MDPRKANGVLICQQCIIQLVYTDVVINKLRNSLQRLKKNVKEAKPKTPFKDSTAAQLRKSADMEKCIMKNGESPQNIPGENDLETNTSEPKSDNKIKPNPSKKTVRRKSLFSDDKEEKHFNEGTPEIATSANVKNKMDNRKKTPTKITKRKITLIDDTLNNNTSSNATMDNSFVEATPVKRSKKKSASTSEESPTILTLDEQGDPVLNKETNVQERRLKEINCIICGKSFHSKSDLRDHIETSHMGERLKACPHCSSEFRSQQKFESHVFSEKCKNTNHACHFPNCYKRFKTVHKMELHMQEKHSSQN